MRLGVSSLIEDARTRGLLGAPRRSKLGELSFPSASAEVRTSILALLSEDGSVPSVDTQMGRAYAAYAAFIGASDPETSVIVEAGGTPTLAAGSPLVQTSSAATPGTTHTQTDGEVCPKDFVRPPRPGDPLDLAVCEEAGLFTGTMKVYQNALSEADARECRRVWQTRSQTVVDGFPTQSQWRYPALLPKPGATALLQLPLCTAVGKDAGHWLASLDSLYHYPGSPKEEGMCRNAYDAALVETRNRYRVPRGMEPIDTAPPIDRPEQPKSSVSALATASPSLVRMPEAGSPYSFTFCEQMAAYVASPFIESKQKLQCRAVLCPVTTVDFGTAAAWDLMSVQRQQTRVMALRSAVKFSSFGARAPGWSVLGTKWQNVGAVRPASGRQLDCPLLTSAISGEKVEFSRRELEEFVKRCSIADGILEDDYVKGGERFWRPKAKRPEGLPLVMHVLSTLGLTQPLHKYTTDSRRKVLQGVQHDIFEEVCIGVFSASTRAHATHAPL